MAVSIWVSSKSSTWELMPLSKAACNTSTRSGRPHSVACGGPKNGASAAMALATVSWRAPPIAQPTQLSSVRAPSCLTAAGRSSKRDATMNRASLWVRSWEATAAWLAGAAAVMVALASRIAPRSEPFMVSPPDPPRSIHAYAGRLDRSGPFLDLAHHELRQIVRRPALSRHHLDAELHEPGLHVGGVHGRVDSIVELADDRGRRALGQEERVPRLDLEIGEALLVGGGEQRQDTRTLP